MRITERNIGRLRRVVRYRKADDIARIYGITEKQVFCIRMSPFGVHEKTLTKQQRWFWLNDILNCARILSGKKPRSWKENPYLAVTGGTGSDDDG